MADASNPNVNPNVNVDTPTPAFVGTPVNSATRVSTNARVAHPADPKNVLQTKGQLEAAQKSLGVGTGDPIRDAALMLERGTTVDPATEDQIVPASHIEAADRVRSFNVMPNQIVPDQVVSEQTSVEMEAGKAALGRHRHGIVRPGGVVPTENIRVPRENATTQEKKIGLGTPLNPPTTT